jgi:ferredoxin like protein
MAGERIMKVDDKLGTTIFHVDQDPHITVQKEICVECEIRPCLAACPAENYKWDDVNNALIFNHEGCLECGTCKLICSLHAVKWSYPKNGKGVLYRFG